MRRVKVRTYSGVVCEQEVFDIPDKLQDMRTARPRRPRFATPEEREQHKLEISRRKHTRLFNANFGPTSLYSTLTFSNEYEVHTFEEAKRLRDNFIRRLQYAYPDVRIMAYLGRGKATQRIHMHMVSEGVPEEYIRSSWKRFHHVMFRPLNPEDPNGNLLKRMIADPYVRVTPVRGESDVFACNFTREAFLEGRWNTRTINARGL